MRIDAARAPRPLLISGAAPVRLQGRNATADRSRLAQLFSEPCAAPGRRTQAEPAGPARRGRRHSVRGLRYPDRPADPGR